MAEATAIDRKQKVAALLLCLDREVSANLLRQAKPESVKDIVVELVKFQLEGGPNGTGLVALQEFFGVLEDRRKVAASPRAFLHDVLPQALGENQAGEYLSQIDTIAGDIDPFYSLRGADVDSLVSALEEERPLTVAFVLLELPPAKSAEVLNRLSEKTRGVVVNKMTSISRPGLEARKRVAAIIGNKLGAGGGEGGGDDNRWRTVVLILRSTQAEVKTSVFKQIKESNEETANNLQEQMVIWEDVKLVDDRSLQQGLRNIGIAPLARALSDADDETKLKISENISERVKTMLYEETELMGRVTDDEVTGARSEILGVLRELDKQGELFFGENT